MRASGPGAAGVGGGEASGRVGPFWLKRARAQSGVLLAGAATVLVVTFLASVMVGLAARSPAVAVRDSIAAGPAADYALALQTSLSDDGAAQDTAVRSVIARTFAHTSVLVSRTASVASAPVVVPAGSPARSVLALEDDPALRTRATITSGSWPADQTAGSPAPVAIDEGTATALGLAVGDAFTITGENGAVHVRVDGIWRPTSAADPAWLGLAAGTGGTDGRVAMPDAAIRKISSTPAVQWVVAPDPARTQPRQLTALDRGFSRIADALTTDSAASASPFAALGRATQSIVAMQQSIGALGAVVPVPLAVLAVCSVIALVLLAQLLMGARRAETRLLRARGATVGGLLRAGAVETGAASLVAAVIGGGLAQVWLGVQAGAPTGPVEVVVPPALVVAASLAVVLLVTAQAARAAIDAPATVDAGRGRTVVSVGLAVLALVAAGVTLWRFLSYGSPIGAGGAVDPVGVVAPAAVLCAVAMLGLLLFGPAAGAVERLAGRDRGLGAILPARQVGRGLGLFAAPVALIVLTVGAATFSAGYVGTWSAFLRDSSHLVNGADVRAVLGVDGSTRGSSDAVDASRFARLPGATGAAPVLGSTYNVGQSAISFITVDAQAIPGLVTVGDYMLDPDRLEQQLTAGAGPLRGIAIPAKADTVRIGARLVVPATTAPADPAATAAAAAPELSITVWLADPHGELVPVRGVAAASAQPAAQLFSFVVPSGGPWMLAAVDTTVDTQGIPTPASVTIDSLDARIGASTAALAVPADQRWAPAPHAFDATFTLTATKGAYFGFDAPLVPADRGSSVRFLPTGGERVPIVLTSAAAADGDFHVGDQVTLDGAWSNLTGVVAGIVPAVPGVTDERAGIADLRAFDNQVLRTAPEVPRLNQVWLAAGDREAVAAEVAHETGPDAVVTTASGTFVSRFMASAVQSLWLGSAGCALLALVAVGAATSALLRRRRGEVVVLRAVGMSGRQQARSRRAEVIGVVFASFVFGLGGGILIFLLAGNALARLSVVTAPSTLSVRGSVDAPALAAALGAVVIAVGAVVWSYGRGVRRQAADTAYREETR